MKNQININDSICLVKERLNFDLYGVYTVKEIHFDKDGEIWFIVVPEYNHKMNRYNHWLPNRDVMKHDPSMLISNNTIVNS